MNMYNSSKTRLQTASKPLLLMMVAGLMFGSAAVQADDIEIYLTPPPNPVPPNVLFILDESGSMDSTTHTATGTHSTRIDDLKNALTNILNDPDNDNINAAIMAYTTHIYNNGPLSLRAVSGFGKIVDNRSAMVSAVNGLDARSYTPSVKALEAGVEWFRNSFTDTPYNWTVAHLGMTPQTYQSPIGNNPVGNWCRPNRMVFLTDGSPNSNRPATAGDPGHWSSHVGAFIPHYGVTAYPAPGTTTPAVACANDPFFGPGYPYYDAGLCSSEIVKWASTTDLKTATGWTGIQNIVTDTIGFGITAGSSQEGYLMNIADEGTGKYYTTANATDLKNAFTSILNNATTSIPYSYSSPTIPYNPDNAAISDDFLYVPMFSPLVKRYWKGNIKKYRVGVTAAGDIFFKDRNGADVVKPDPTTGVLFFDLNTQDYWSNTANTGETYEGGAMSKMSAVTPRNLYTWLPGNDVDLTATLSATDPNGLPVTISPNRVHTDNIIITSGLLTTATAAKRKTVLDWANWIGDGPPPVTVPVTTNTTNDDFPQAIAPANNGDGVREFMGAPVHTAPQVARYRPAISFVPDDGAGGGAVDSTLDTITFTQANIWATGERVVYTASGAGIPIQGGGALSNNGEYFVISVSGTALQLAATAADASAGVAIDLADATGLIGPHTLTTRVAIDVVLVATSEGVLHAFSGGTDTVATAVGDGGGELWSFMPREFLDNITGLRDNPSANTPEYGLDGPITIYETGGKKYVAITMRRGGRNIYVLDITDIAKPKMAWEIIGGTTAGFTRLGQTWSEVQFLTMEINGAAARDVLVFGGGYDNVTQDHDNTGVIPATRADDTMGNAVYVVDAITGARVAYFSADTTTDTSPSQNRLQVAGMENGIIGVLPVDINNNGIIDRLYASDVGGRIIRLDIPDSVFADTTISGGVVADVNTGGSGFQRFFNKPEVAFYSRGGTQFLGILIGSGYRPSPLNDAVTDHFYMIKDANVFDVPTTYVALGEGDLYDATGNEIQDGSAAQQVAAVAALNAKNGWFIDLLDGSSKQKVYSAARIFNSVIFFTTYQGTRPPVADVCEIAASKGSSKIYAVSLLDATAALDLDDNGILNIGDRNLTTNQPGIGSPPWLTYDPGGGGGGSGLKVTVGVGLESVFKFPDRFFPVNWEEIIP